MKNSIDRQLKRYYRDITKALPAEGKKTILPGIRSGVGAYLAEKPDATINDVISYVGTPECIANEYYANQDGAKITGEINAGRKKIMLISMIAAAVLLVFFVTMLVIAIYNIRYRSVPTYYTTELEEIYRGDVSAIDLPGER